MIITNEPEVIISHDVPQVIADHDLILVVINKDKPKRPSVTKNIHNFRNYSNDVFCSLPYNINITNKLFYTDNVGNQVRILNETLNLRGTQVVTLGSKAVLFTKFCKGGTSVTHFH